MKSSVTKDLFQYNPMLVNWVLELLNWLEFKDGDTQTTQIPF